MSPEQHEIAKLKKQISEMARFLLRFHVDDLYTEDFILLKEMIKENREEEESEG